MKIRMLSAVFSVLLLSGCTCFSPFSESLDKGEAVPSGKVLVIGRMIVDPPLEQGNINVIAPRGSNKGVIKMNFAADAAKPLDKTSMFPFSVSQIADFSFTETSFLPMKPGVQYARLGTLMLDSRATNYVASSSGAMSPRGLEVTNLLLYGDLKITIPAKAKAVYIGTIVYRHDIQHTPPNEYGYYTKRVSVRDDYGAAMNDLAARKIPGIKPKDVVKKLAVVIREN